MFPWKKAEDTELLQSLSLEGVNPMPTSEESGFYKESVPGDTGPGIAAAVNILSKKVITPTTKDWTAVKRVQKSLKHTAHFKLGLPATNWDMLMQIGLEGDHT